jgi:hypothetical protein
MGDGRIVSASMDKTIRVHGSPSAILRAHAGAVGAVALSHDESLMASASFDGTIRIWDSATYRVLDVLREKCSKFPVGLAFHPAKPILAMVVDGGNAIEILELNREAVKPPAEPMMVGNDPYRKVWVYMVDGKNTQDLRSLERGDAHTWAANPNSRKGDVILMYRTAPYSDFRYVFQALADARAAKPSEDFAEWVIRLGNKRTLYHPVTLAEIKAEPGLHNWSFTKMQQGAMRWTHDVRQQEYWPPLRDLILRHNPGILADRTDTAAPAAKHAGFQYAAYLSYDRAAQLPIERIYEALSKELKSYLDAPIFLDRQQIKPGDRLEEALAHALFASACFIPICTPNYFDRPNCMREYVAMETLEIQRLAAGGEERDRKSVV